MEGTFRTNKHYRELRDAFILDNEGFRRTVYFDHRGIPTFSKGIALLTPVGKSKNDKKPGKTFGRHNENINACRKVLGKDSTLEKSLEDFADEALEGIDHTLEPVYPIIKKKTLRTVSFFQTTPRGKQLVQMIGPLNGNWESSRSPTVSQAQAEEIYSAVIDQREEYLEGYLKEVKLDPAKLTEEQRIVLVDAVYHGRWNSGGKKAAEAIRDGKSVEAISKCLYNPQFPGRTKKVSQLLNKTWQPPKSNNDIPPSRSVKEPGISPEQLSLLREYLLAQSLSQPIGCTAFEQVFGRFMGAGSDGPWKNPCDPYGDMERRYGD